MRTKLKLLKDNEGETNMTKQSELMTTLYNKYKPLFKEYQFTLDMDQFETNSTTWYIREDWQTYYDDRVAMKHFDKKNVKELEKWLSYYLEFVKNYRFLKTEIKHDKDINFEIRDFSDRNGLDYKSGEMDFKIMNSKVENFDQTTYYLKFKINTEQVDVLVKARAALHKDTTIQSGNIDLNLECDHDVLFYNLTQKLTTTKESLYADLMKVIKQMNKLKQSFVNKKMKL